MTDDPERDPHLEARFAALDGVAPPDVWHRVTGAPFGQRRRRRVLLVAAGILFLAGIAATWAVLSSSDEGSVDIGPSGPAGTAPGDASPTPPDTTPSTTTTAPPIPAVSEFLDEPALVEFFERLPDIHTFDRPGPVLLVLVEPDHGSSAEALDHPESIEGLTVWPQGLAWLEFQEAMADRPDLAASIRMEDMPHGVAIHPRFAETPFAELAEPYLAQEGVLGVVPLYDEPPEVTHDAPPGWEELATVDGDLERHEFAVMSGSSLVAWTAQGLVAIDADGTVRKGESGPFPVDQLCCGSYRAVGTEESVIVLGSEAGTMAAVIDTASLTWRRLEDRPGDGWVRDAAVRADGEVVVLAGGGTSELGRLYGLDPARDRWRDLPSLPMGLDPVGVAADGSRLVVFGVDGGRGIVHGLRVLELADDEWQELESPPIGATAVEVIPEGDGLLAWNYSLESASHDGSAWTLLPELPLAPSECSPVGTITDVGAVANQCGGLIRYDRTEGRWHPIPQLDADWRRWDPVVGRDRILALEATSPDSSLVFVRMLETTN